MLTLVPSSGDADDPPITEVDLEAWLTTAQPGDRLIYHRGFLAVDASGSTGRLPPPQARELRRVARLAFAAVERGVVHAVQQRNGPNDFTYLLIVRPQPRRRRSLPSLLRFDPAHCPPLRPLGGADNLIHVNA